MSIKAKTKGFIAIKGINLTKFAKQNGKQIQAISRTYARDTIKLKELLELCAIADCHIAIIDNNSGRELITYNRYDIEDTDKQDKD